MKELLTRTASGAVYVLLMIVAIYGGQWFAEENKWVGIIIFNVIFMAIGMIGVYETIHNLQLGGHRVNAPIAYVAGALSLLLFSTLANVWLSELQLIFAILIPAIVMISQLWSHDESPMEMIGNTILPLVWVVLPIILLGYLHDDYPGRVMIMFILIWVNDSFAYLTGRLIGRHKMWERHSPGKTWEGTIGGFVFCVAAAIFIGPYLDPWTAEGWRWAIVGATCSITATLGDLVESMFKRSCGVKDSGNIMPGHGGVLDRFDSILMTTPFMMIVFNS